MISAAAVVVVWGLEQKEHFLKIREREFGRRGFLVFKGSGYVVSVREPSFQVSGNVVVIHV